MADNPFDDPFDLNSEIKIIRAKIKSHETSYRVAMHEFVGGLFPLVKKISETPRLQAELREAHNKIFQPHPHATETWQLIKLCIHLTGATQASAHRWSQAIDVGLAAGWSWDEFRARLADGGIDGILNHRKSPGSPQPRAPLKLAESPVLMALGPIDLARPIDLEEAAPYVMVATFRGGQLDVTDCMKLTRALTRALEAARSPTIVKKTPDKSKSKRIKKIAA